MLLADEKERYPRDEGVLRREGKMPDNKYKLLSFGGGEEGIPKTARFNNWFSIRLMFARLQSSKKDAKKVALSLSPRFFVHLHLYLP